jgi:hypothetical protein
MLNQSTKTGPSMQTSKHPKGNHTMFKIIAAIILCTAVFARAADFVFPGFRSTDAAAYEAQIPNADSPMRKVLCASLAEFCHNKPADFAAMKGTIEGVITQQVPDASENFKLDMVKLLSYRRGLVYKDDTYIRDAWAYCLAHPSTNDVEFLMLPADRLGTTEAIKIARTWELLAEGKVGPYHITRLLRAYVQYLPASGLSSQDAYERLTTLNRVYTPKLIENKAAWEPIVAQIRTVMEAYK